MHAGPHSAHAATFRHEVAFLAQQGYACILPNFRCARSPSPLDVHHGGCRSCAHVLWRAVAPACVMRTLVGGQGLAGVWRGQRAGAAWPHRRTGC